MRKVIAIAAVPGLLAGVYTMGASFLGLTMDKLGMKAFVLHFGIVALLLPLVIVEPASKGVNPFSGKPLWVVRSIQTLGVLCIALFLLFLALSHAASPDIIGGHYVLNSHGKIVGLISERQYFFLKGWELRMFASGWIFFNYTLMMSWRFPRQNEWTVVMPGKQRSR
jgi:hypothetical protein